MWGWTFKVRDALAYFTNLAGSPIFANESVIRHARMCAYVRVCALSVLKHYVHLESSNAHSRSCVLKYIWLKQILFFGCIFATNTTKCWYFDNNISWAFMNGKQVWCLVFTTWRLWYYMYITCDHDPIGLYPVVVKTALQTFIPFFI